MSQLHSVRMRFGAALITGASALAVERGFAAPPPDFNGDGFADLAIGVPNEDINGIVNAGAVNVIYGSPVGLQASGNQLWSQDSPGILDVAESNDRFGAALTWGDFNGDGFTDLAVGVAMEDINDLLDAGAVNVLYGSPSGLTAAGNQFWNENSPGIEDTAEPGDEFGWSVAAGDFNGDGFDDLAIGVIGEDIALNPNAGAVHILYGSPLGLRNFADEIWTQDSGGIDDVSEPNDLFGWSLATGDFDGDGFDDLAIGVRNEDISQNVFGFVIDAGAVNVIYGSGTGLQGSGDQFWHQNVLGVADAAESGDIFGFALAAGDFNHDGRDDLAIGIPFEDIGFASNAGAVQVLYGGINGLRNVGNQFLSLDTPGFLGPANLSVEFGFSVTAADFDGDGFADLAIGAPGQAIGILLSAGAVHVVYGSSNGLDHETAEIWHQNRPGIRGDAGVNDQFGASLTSGDYNGDGRADLAIGVPLEDIGLSFDAGAVNVIYGTPTGLRGLNDQIWSQNSPGIKGIANVTDFFGSWGPLGIQ